MFTKARLALSITLLLSIAGCSKAPQSSDTNAVRSPEEIQNSVQEMYGMLYEADRDTQFVDMDGERFPVATIGFAGFDTRHTILGLQLDAYYSDLFTRLTRENGKLVDGNDKQDVDAVFIGDLGAFKESDMSIDSLTTRIPSNGFIVVLGVLDENTEESALTQPFLDAGLRFQASWQVDVDEPTTVDSFDEANQHRAKRLMMRFVKDA